MDFMQKLNIMLNYVHKRLKAVFLSNTLPLNQSTKKDLMTKSEFSSTGRIQNGNFPCVFENEKLFYVKKM